MNLRITPPDEMIEATISLPLSKSISNRCIIINALTPGAQPLPTDSLAACDDTAALSSIIAARTATTDEITVDAGAAGTAMRFATAWLATLEGRVTTIDGTPRMRRRPIATLVDALRALGAEIEYAGEEGFPPLRITGHNLMGGRIKVDATVSSQFISALLMIAPTMRDGLHIDLDGETISTPYIKMTLGLMERAGINCEADPMHIAVAPGTYRPTAPYSERDWSAASYWYALAAISAGFITLPGLSTESLQGDARAVSLFEQLGVVTAPSEEVDGALEICPSPEQFSRFEQDLTDNPDLAPALAVTSAMLGIPFHLRSLASLRIKETDRLEAIRRELDKFGIIVEVRGGSELVWNGERHPIFELPHIDTYDDHRMAMAFAPAAVFIPDLVINNAEVVSKSYPDFWSHFELAGFTLTDADTPAPAADDDLTGLGSLSSDMPNPSQSIL